MVESAATARERLRSVLIPHFDAADSPPLGPPFSSRKTSILKKTDVSSKIDISKAIAEGSTNPYQYCALPFVKSQQIQTQSQLSRDKTPSVSTAARTFFEQAEWILLRAEAECRPKNSQEPSSEHICTSQQNSTHSCNTHVLESKLCGIPIGDCHRSHCRSQFPECDLRVSSQGGFEPISLCHRMCPSVLNKQRASVAQEQRVLNEQDQQTRPIAGEISNKRFSFLPSLNRYQSTSHSRRLMQLDKFKKYYEIFPYPSALTQSSETAGMTSHIPPLLVTQTLELPPQQKPSNRPALMSSSYSVRLLTV